MDLRIPTHGTPGYRSVKRGESNGCKGYRAKAVKRMVPLSAFP